ncbi:MAG: outer membrane lipoprotein carrier protein LolA [Paludibacteraceae bacterium]|nr:outer membrane lipoprotein carrier protein LolA [Paludibacteraceae bacterium]
MKKLGIFIVLAMASLCLSMAQSVVPVSDVAGLKAKMQAAATNVTSIQSDFTQEKYISAMGKSMNSSGKFYYQKENKVKLEYLSPYKQNMVMNGNKLMMEMGNNKNVMDASANPMAAELKKVISACMSGNIANMGENYILEYFQEGTNYLVKITPKSADIKKFAQEVELYLDMKDFSVVKMKMIEPIKPGFKKNDYTLYTFTNKKMNVKVDDAVFVIK